MARKSYKSALNQGTGSSEDNEIGKIIEDTVTDMDEETINMEVEPFTPESNLETETTEDPVSDETPNDDPIIEPDTTEEDVESEIEEADVAKKPKRKVAELNPTEYRYFLNTGIIPD